MNNNTCSSTPYYSISIDASCKNNNGGYSTSVAPPANGQLTTTSYSLPNCAGVETSYSFLFSTNCIVPANNDDDYNGTVSNSSILYTYAGGPSSPAARWAVDVGLAALLAVVACMAI